MDAAWKELHRDYQSRANTIRQLKKIDTKAWISIVREKACIAMDMKAWGNVVRMLALDCSEDEIRDACPLPENEDEDDAMTLAKKLLYRAVKGEMDLDDKGRFAAAQMIIRLKVGKTDESGNTTINVNTGVPRE
jgi:hypothetical protein